MFGAAAKTTASAYSSYSRKGSSGVLNDLIDFLENNVESFDNYDANDVLDDILTSTDVKEVMTETDETSSIVSQLEKKMSSITSDLSSCKKEMEQVKGQRYGAERIEREIDLSERIAGLQAKEKVVSGHLKRARKRLIMLQERTKDLMRDRRDKR